ALAKLRNSRLLAYIGKGPVAVVAIQRMITGRQAARAALDRHALPIAVAVGARFGYVLEIELKVIGDEEIEMAVTVIVNERAARTPTRAFIQKSCFFADIRERTVAIVAIELVLAEIRDE